MSIVYDILKELTSTTVRYKGSRVNLLGLPKFKKYPSSSLRGTMSLLVKKGFVKDGEELYITSKGQNYIKSKFDSLKKFNFKSDKNVPKNLMVMFDVPEPKKAEREWLRWHLKKFNYIMIQKSVWVGPSPLPKDFLDYLKEIKLIESVKTFKLAKGYNTNTKKL